MASLQFNTESDFVFRQVQLAPFVDGCFWHSCLRCYGAPKSNRAFWKNKVSRNRERDRLVNRTLRRANWRVLRIWEHALRQATIKPQNEARLIRRIHEKLKSD